MKTVLTAVCVFTMLASLWLFTRFLTLRHPGFEARAALSLFFVAVGLATLATLYQARPTFALTVVVAVGAAAITFLGTEAVIMNNLRRSGHYEGYVDLIGVALVAQGLLTIWWAVVRRFNSTRR